MSENKQRPLQWALDILVIAGSLGVALLPGPAWKFPVYPGLLAALLVVALLFKKRSGDEAVVIAGLVTGVFAGLTIGHYFDVHGVVPLMGICGVISVLVMWRLVAIDIRLTAAALVPPVLGTEQDMTE